MNKLFTILIALSIATYCGAQIFDKRKPLSEDTYIVEQNGMKAVTDKDGRILSGWVDAIIPIDGEYFQLVKNTEDGDSRCAIIRANNWELVTGWDFSWVFTPLKNGLIPVKLLRGDKLGHTHKKLKMMGNFYYMADSLSEGMYSFTDMKTKKMGIMTEDGNILVPPIYDEVGDFKCGMCRVWILEKGNGFIDTSGTLVIPCRYPQALDFGSIQGVSRHTQVWDSYGISYFIDKKGKRVAAETVIREAYDCEQARNGGLPIKLD